MPPRGGALRAGLESDIADLERDVRVGARAEEQRQIDLREHPKYARSDDILAVPTLVRRLPEPITKIIGDLSDREKVLIGLSLSPR